MVQITLVWDRSISSCLLGSTHCCLLGQHKFIMLSLELIYKMCKLFHRNEWLPPENIGGKENEGLEGCSNYGISMQANVEGGLNS